MKNNSIVRGKSGVIPALSGNCKSQEPKTPPKADTFQRKVNQEVEFWHILFAKQAKISLPGQGQFFMPSNTTSISAKGAKKEELLGNKNSNICERLIIDFAYYQSKLIYWVCPCGLALGSQAFSFYPVRSSLAEVLRTPALGRERDF